MSIRDQYPQEYRLYGLSSLAVAVAFPRIKTLLQHWDMLTFPTLHSKVFESWRHLLKGEEVEGDGIPGESRSDEILVHALAAYMSLVQSPWVSCCVRRSGIKPCGDGVLNFIVCNVRTI